MSVRGDKLDAMKNVHLLIADLFLPNDFAAEVCRDLQLPALEKILARGSASHTGVPVSLEAALCSLFAVPGAQVAPVSADFDGLDAGCWLRADPVHVRLQREHLVMLPVLDVSANEALQLCASLNAHFADDGLEFFAPHPQRWYVRLESLPDMVTVPLSQASGRNIQGLLPTGAEARRWRHLFNEAQMLLFSHPLNEIREAQGVETINSVWFWGAGQRMICQAKYAHVSSDETLVEMLAKSAGISFDSWSPSWRDCGASETLLAWFGLRSALQCGDLAAWRAALQAFETDYAQPLWQALRAGKIDHLTLQVLGGDNMRQFELSRGASWAFWRRGRRLADYSASVAGEH